MPIMWRRLHAPHGMTPNFITYFIASLYYRSLSLFNYTNLSTKNFMNGYKLSSLFFFQKSFLLYPIIPSFLIMSIKWVLYCVLHAWKEWKLVEIKRTKFRNLNKELSLITIKWEHFLDKNSIFGEVLMPISRMLSACKNFFKCSKKFLDHWY